MNLLDAAILGIVQGLTEFLPISSSGHLVIFQNVLGISSSIDFIFDTALHFGTLIALILFFISEIFGLLKSFLKVASALFHCRFYQVLHDPDIKLLILIIAASVPTAFIGLLLGTAAEKLFSSVRITGGMLIITGFILWFTKYIRYNKFDIEKFSFKKAMLVGTAQGLAVIPGISRSGVTISIGLFFGIKPELCARFSFLLSIPAILGAQIISFTNFTYEIIPLQIIVGGIFAAFVTGYIALIFLMKIIKKRKILLFCSLLLVYGYISSF